MTDRTTKFLLGAIALLLTGLLVRPMLAPLPAQAQVSATSGPIQMIEDRGMVYLLQNDTLSVYQVRESSTGRPTDRGGIQVVAQKRITPLS